jgi:hypothetical protein
MVEVAGVYGAGSGLIMPSEKGLCTSNGKTSIVRYRTLSFFAFRFLKKRMFAFFRDFKCKISIQPVRFASILVHV